MYLLFNVIATIVNLFFIVINCIMISKGYDIEFFAMTLGMHLALFCIFLAAVLAVIF